MLVFFGPQGWPATLLACAAALACTAAGAQQLLRENPQAPQDVQAPPFLPQASPRGLELPPVGAPGLARAALPAAGEVLRELDLRGNTSIAREELMEVARPWLGRRVNEADLEALRIELTRHYVQRGYINSGARLDPQGLRDGRLAIDILEGRLSAIRFSGLDGLRERYLVEKLRPYPDRPLNVNELRERYQLVLEDPLIQRMNARLVPDVEEGSARLDVAVERAAPWYVSLRASNHRPASIGERSAGVEIGLRNLTGRGDLLRINVQPEERFHSIARRGIGWNVPVNYAGTQLSAQIDDGASSVVEEPLRAIDVRSRLTVRELGLGQLLVENLRHRGAIGLTVQDRTNRSWIGGERFAFIAGAPEDGLRTRSLRFWQEYAFRSEAQVVALRSTFAAARNNLEPLPAPAKALVAQRSYRFWLGQAQLARKLNEGGVQAIARLTVQATSARMVALDGLSIGGAATVRGFRENQLVRDTGQIVNLELDLPVLRSGTTDTTLNLVPFVDFGRGKNQGEPADVIASAGLAVRWRAGALAAEVAWGKRIRSTVGFSRAGGTLQDHGVHAQVSYTLGR